MRYVNAAELKVPDQYMDVIKEVLSTLPVGQAYEIQRLPINRRLLMKWQNAARYYGRTNGLAFSIIKDDKSYWIIRKA